MLYEVITVAKTAVAVDHLHRVMARGADQGKGAPGFLFEHQAGGLNGAASGNPMRFGAHLLHRGETEMGPHDVFIGGVEGAVFVDTVDIKKPFLAKLVLGA